MNRNCDLVKDLLPLYIENMVSQPSKALVEKHLSVCESCRREWNVFQKDLILPRNTNTDSLLRLRKKVCTRILAAVFSVVCGVMMLLSVLFVLNTIPVWLPAEEAIEAIVVTDDGILEIVPAECANGLYPFGNGVLYMGLRRNPVSRQKMQQMLGRSPDQIALDESGSMWYAGVLIGEEDVLLYGQGSFALNQWDAQNMDWTMKYLFWGSLLLGALLVFAVVPFRKKKAGVVLGYAGLLSLLFAGACLFVTNGVFLTLTGVSKNLFTVSGLWIRVIASGVLSISAWGLILSILCLTRREDRNETEL